MPGDEFFTRDVALDAALAHMPLPGGGGGAEGEWFQSWVEQGLCMPCRKATCAQPDRIAPALHRRTDRPLL